ncbi:sensor domain-containing protein [Thiosulfativibrio zosterae]|uniref:Histidine kinase n=1 Tax=Thiosulfativibrio zosterae TaxID=2675053 RepID=A0A6F8PKK3_9GAMM|nr:EAL domain-containing protein [Thiosulfativibrio zosterae]BBP42629.1 histidine kinase [Thiosulfativibrio zosterae]
MENIKGLDSPAKLEEALHELQVHQIELEFQNEELQHIQEALNATKNRYQELFKNAPVGYCSLNEKGQILEANLTTLALLDQTEESLVNTAITNYIFSEDQDTYYFCRQKVIAQLDSTQTCDLRLLKKDQSIFWAKLTLATSFNNASQTVFRLVIQDISEQKKSEEQLKLAASFFSAAGEGIMITDAQNNILKVNPSFTTITGYQAEEVIGQNPKILSSSENCQSFYEQLWNRLEKEGSWKGEIINRRKNGELIEVIMHITTIVNHVNEVQRYIALYSDNSLVKQRELQLKNLAHFDPLTGLPNRTLLADRINQAMILTQRTFNPMVLAFLDLDGFKEINDNYGHDQGDLLLVTLSKTMQKVLREGDTLARIGGDEFVILMPNLKHINDAVPLIKRLLETVALPIQIKKVKINVTASIGLTQFPQEITVDADQLMRQADQAMYQAKIAGKNRFEFFNLQLNDNLKAHYEYLDQISNGLNMGEFELYYQPKVEMRTGNLIGAEALIRWQHPDKGLLSPLTFLPQIEEHPLSITLGEWVIHQALKQLETWKTKNIAIAISVNISAHHLMQSNFAERLAEILAEHPSVNPADLQIEILETSQIEDLKHTTNMINLCNKLGVSFALDDFGTGYSSLTYLKKLPIHQIKIDQSFVKEMLYNINDLSILEAIISLAEAFQHEVLAEGVETIEQGNILLQLGCELAQGYAISKPLPASDFPNWLSNWQPPQEWINSELQTHDEVSLLFAKVEYQAWASSITAFLKGDYPYVPKLNQDECRFGKLINSIEHKQHQLQYPQNQAQWVDIKALHQKSHILAAELVSLNEQNNTLLLAQKLVAFKKLSKELLAKIAQL